MPHDSYRITIVPGRPETFLGVHHNDDGQPYAYVSDESPWRVTKEMLDANHHEAAAHALSKKLYAKHWHREIRAMRKAMKDQQAATPPRTPDPA